MGGEERSFPPRKSWGAGVLMHPELLLMVIRQDHERLECDAARGRLAASLGGSRQPWLPRRIVGRLLVRVGLWLLASLPATSGRARSDTEAPAPASGRDRAMIAP
jgi:hypothetical protein